MKKNKIALLMTGVMLSAALMTGCGKNDKDKKADAGTEQDSATINVSPIETMGDAEDIVVIQKDGYVLSELTGEWIDESLEKQRPLCIMINNIQDAMPQSGISQADITYEMLVEGGITRMLCVFKDWHNVEKLGPVRSARLYYVKTAAMYDGYYAHVGWNTYAEEAINNYHVDNLNGLTNLSTIMFYRDESRYAPHNVYTNKDMIDAGIAEDKYRTEYNDDHTNMWKFYYHDTDMEDGKTANKISIGFNSKPWFEYDADSKLYNRFQYNGPQIDDQTGEQLKYKNVVVLFVQYTDIWEGLLDIDFTKGGTGYYATNGSYEPITWCNENGQVRCYTEDGNELKMNPGQTFVTEFDENNTDGVVFE